MNKNQESNQERLAAAKAKLQRAFTGLAGSITRYQAAAQQATQTIKTFKANL